MEGGTIDQVQEKANLSFLRKSHSLCRLQGSKETFKIHDGCGKNHSETNFRNLCPSPTSTRESDQKSASSRTHSVRLRLRSIEKCHHEETMKVILKQDYDALGKSGDIVTVKDGYARNFLIPKNIAVSATPKNRRILEEEEKLLQRRQDKDKRQAEVIAKELEKISLTAAVSVGEEDRVFGSVTAQTIADLLKVKGYEIDKRKIHLEEPIKALGIYTISLKLHAEVEAKIRVWVVKE